MMNSGLSASDVALLTANTGNGGRNNDGFFGGDGAWWLIILAFFLFGGFGGYGGYGAGGGMGGGATPYFVGASTQSEIQRGFDNQAVISKLDGITNGLSDGFYAVNTGMLQGFNGVQNALCQGFNGVQQGLNGVNVAMLQGFNGTERGFSALATQLAQCCCDNRAAIADVKYQMATDTCSIQNTIQNTTRDILESNNANTRAILDFITQDKIATLTAENQSLKMAASQSNQNAVLMAAMDANKAEILRKTGAECPTAAYIVQPPQPVTFPVNCYGQFNGYGQSYNAGCCG